MADKTPSKRLTRDISSIVQFHGPAPFFDLLTTQIHGEIVVAFAQASPVGVEKDKGSREFTLITGLNCVAYKSEFEFDTDILNRLIVQYFGGENTRTVKDEFDDICKLINKKFKGIMDVVRVYHDAEKDQSKKPTSDLFDEPAMNDNVCGEIKFGIDEEFHKMEDLAGMPEFHHNKKKLNDAAKIAAD
ncbi:hypothetical protein HAX54_011467 [Datura stramonium]|uniref:Uncharacterized protein n=1 Tax=Datura stramonium TaxID=4076 RepID=A0ABS8Y4S9_DATST|nr:hypothetical protein [Datura stramonium]